MRAIFDWLEFKDIGDDLSKNFEESYVRAAIIMYYYAIFSAIREYLVKIKKNINFWIILEFMKEFGNIWYPLIIIMKMK